MEQMTFRELTDKMMSHYNARDYTSALEVVEQNEIHFPEQAVRITFWRMCLLSLCGRSADVISVFQQGLNEGFWWSGSQFLDSDLDAVRDLPEFNHLMAVSKKKYEEARRHIERDQTILLPNPPASGKHPLLIALHGYSGTKDSHLEYWEIARQRGWLVLLPQSTQPLFPGSFCWDDSAQGLTDIRFYYEQISQKYQIDPQRVVIAGFSQGSGMAIYGALSGRVGVRGFIGIGTFIAEPDWLIPLASQSGSVRGYFIAGEKDHTLDKAKAIQTILKENHIQFGEEIHPNLAHEFPPDFGPSFDKAIKYIFKENE